MSFYALLEADHALGGAFFAAQGFDAALECLLQRFEFLRTEVACADYRVQSFGTLALGRRRVVPGRSALVHIGVALALLTDSSQQRTVAWVVAL